MGARQTALGVLIACRKQGAWSDGVMKEYALRDKLDRREAALASRLCYGVLQNRMLLDYHLASLVKGKLKDLQPVVLDILRLGLYQILFLDKIPDSAAVNEAVESCKKYANNRASGLVNGVLRNAIRRKDSLTPPADPAIRYSHPKALVELLRQQMTPEELEQTLRGGNGVPPTVVQCNALRSDPQTLTEIFEKAGGTCRMHPWLPGCLEVTGAGSLERLDCFTSGLCYVQDAASRLAVRCAGIQPGMRVLDACAAPGGKSFAAAMEMEGKGILVSCDIHPHKIELIRKGAARLGFDCIHPIEQDASRFVPDWAEGMDVVLVDAPCSGLGIIRKKPDIRYKDLTQTEALPALQRRILENQCRYVRPGGVLLYSTCTILRRENEDVAEDFLKAHPEFAPEPLELPAPLEPNTTGMLTLLPGQYDTDGFFICKMRRKL